MITAGYLVLSAFSFMAQAGIAGGQPYSATPQPIPQGRALKLQGPREAVHARMNNVTIPMFIQPDAHSFGLMPVGVLTKPGVYKLEFLDQAGAVIHASDITVRDARYPRQNIVLSQALTELKSSDEEREKVQAFQKEVLPERYWAEPLRLPIPGCLTSPFGVARLVNGKLTGSYHGGIDQRGSMGTPIHAVAAGKIRIAQMFTLRGGTVAIDHGQGLQSIYMHMSRLGSAEGQEVKAGDVIGYVGTTGRSTAPHLHWALYANGIPVSPLQWVKVPSCVAPKPKAKSK